MPALKDLSFQFHPTLSFRAKPRGVERNLQFVLSVRGGYKSNGPSGECCEAICNVPPNANKGARRPSASSAEIRATEGLLFCSERCARTRCRASPSNTSQSAKKSLTVAFERCPVLLITRCLMCQGYGPTLSISRS